MPSKSELRKRLSKLKREERLLTKVVPLVKEGKERYWMRRLAKNIQTQARLEIRLKGVRASEIRHGLRIKLVIR